MPIPGVHIETVANPIAYTHAQIEQACQVAAILARGKLALTVPPPHDCEPALDDYGVCCWCRRRPE
jgi:hypothetical protein